MLSLIVSLGHEPMDCGTYQKESCDYPDYVKKVAKAVTSRQCDRGVFICGTGLGPSMAANKIDGIRAALCHDTFSAQQSREHNDANVLCMGARVIGSGLAAEIVKTWLSADFSGDERHRRRIAKIMAFE